MKGQCSTTGGYPKIGCVIRADLPRLAQCRPGKDQLKFQETTVEAAQGKYRELVQRLRSGIQDAE